MRRTLTMCALLLLMSACGKGCRVCEGCFDSVVTADEEQIDERNAERIERWYQETEAVDAADIELIYGERCEHDVDGGDVEAEVVDCDDQVGLAY